MTDKLLDLALDLDQTLIHAHEIPIVNRHSRKARLYEEHESYLCKFIENDKLYYIYCRPGLFNFLDKVHKKYNIHIYTYGTKEYALHITGHICGKMKRMLFKNVYSRENFVNYKKKLLGYNDESNTIIVDDNPKYWDDYSANLIIINPYHGPFHSNYDDELDRVLKDLDKILIVYKKCGVIDNSNTIFTCIDSDSDNNSDSYSNSDMEI